MSLLPVPRTSDLHEVSLVLSASPCIALHRSLPASPPLSHTTQSSASLTGTRWLPKRSYRDSAHPLVSALMMLKCSASSRSMA